LPARPTQALNPISFDSASVMCSSAGLFVRHYAAVVPAKGTARFPACAISCVIGNVYCNAPSEPPNALGTTTRAVLFGAFEAIIVFAIVAATLHLGYGLGVRLNAWERT
jgi:hypothetical protein